VEKGNLSIKPFKKDKLAYVMSLILERASIRKDNLLTGGYTPINAVILQNIIGNQYKEYLKLLVDEGILESNCYHQAGEQSKGYRFTQIYKGKLTEYKLTDFILRQNIKDFGKKGERKRIPISGQQKSADEKLPDKSYNKGIYKWYNDGKLKVDSTLANKYAEAVFEYKAKDKNRWDISYPSGEKKDPWYQYTNMTVNIGKIERAEFGEHFDGNVNRFHSVLTYCKKEIRHALDYDGEKLVAVDLCNSQPYLSTALFQSGFWESQNGKFSLFHLSTPLSSIISPSKLSSFIMFTKTTSNPILSKVPADIKEYVSAVSGGKFYEDFQALIIKNGGDKIERDNIKVMMFTVLFTDNRFINQKDADKKRLFKETFPNVYEVFKRVKQVKSENLPKLLQQMESYIFTKRIGLRLAREHPNIPFWTIHDSIVTTVSNVDKVEKIVEEELLDCIGLPPTLKREYWDKTILQKEIDRIKS
jgi:hypothetical protein